MITDLFVRQKPEWRRRCGEVGLAPPYRDRMDIDAVFVHQAKRGQGARQLRPRHFYDALMFRFQLAHGCRQIAANQLRLGADRSQSA